MKIFVVGKSRGYANWMGGTIVDRLEESDLVLFTGGSDVSPNLYKDTVGKFTYCDPDRDKLEVAIYKNAIELNKKIIGICRGSQLSCVMAGGKLVQHMGHPGYHPVRLYDGTELMLNSTHHQMQYPFILPNSDYFIVAHAEELSNCHYDGRMKNMDLPVNNMGRKIEPEIVYYRKTQALAIQCHPESMGLTTEAVKKCRVLLQHHMNDTLDLALMCKIPFRKLESDGFEFTSEEKELYEQINGKKIEKTSSTKEVYAK